MSQKVRKAVFPVAGLGTRLLPATKSIPKEMITVVDRPLIQYAVDEAREAGIEQLIFVTGRGKSALVDYFDSAYELEATMRGKGKSLDPLAPSRAGFGELDQSWPALRILHQAAAVDARYGITTQRFAEGSDGQRVLRRAAGEWVQ